MAERNDAESESGTQQPDAYCPTCDEKLLPDEYDAIDGCHECGAENLWLSPEAFSRLLAKWAEEEGWA